MMRWLAIGMVVWMLTGMAGAAEIYVSPSATAGGDGSKQHPLQNLEQAQQAARQLAGKEPVTVWLSGGTYYLPQTLVFTSADSGTKDAPVVYCAVPGETPVISGGVKLQLTWSGYRDGIMQASVPDAMVADQLFVDGEARPMARYPNYDPDAKYFNGTAADCISPERVKRWAGPAGGFVHAMHSAMWGDFHYRILGRDAAGNLKLEGGWQNNRRMGMHKSLRFVENIFEELDAPGEWYLDQKSHTLYFYPPKGLDLAKATVEMVRLAHLVDFRGTQQAPVRFVSMRGITFRHALRTFMDNREPLLRSDWTTYRGGAIFFSGAEDCALQECTLDRLGGNAVYASGYNRRLAVRGCEIVGAGASGVSFVGEPKAVRNPLLEYNQRLSIDQIDRTPGPKSDDYPADCVVEDCLIHRSGRIEKQSAGVQIAMSRRIRVSHCSIYDVPRAGINIGDGCWGGDVVEYCDVFDTVKETGDHGSFNSWGRDRYWGLKGVDLNRVTLGAEKDLPLLDCVEPIILRNSRWRCDHGWDIDLDDGSSHYIVSHNLLLNGGLKFREGFYRVAENNVIVNNSFHPHVWYGNSQDVVRRNIVCTSYRPIGMKAPWGRECDENLLDVPGQAPVPAKALAEQSGRDAHSLAGDALFVDPAKGDFRVKADSPALKLGFENFPMDQFGVTSDRLRKIARRPEIPLLRGEQRQERAAVGRRWGGGRVKDLRGEGERSATGMGEDTGMLVVEPGRGRLAKIGLQENDVVLKWDQKPVRNAVDFLRFYNDCPGGTQVSLQVWRGQKAVEVRFKRDAEVELNAGDATVEGDGAHPVYDQRKDFLGSWTNAGASLHWKMRLWRPGVYAASIIIACQPGSEGSEYALIVAGREIRGKVPSTGGWERFVERPVGKVDLSDVPAGEIEVTLKPLSRPGNAVMNLRAIRLTPE